jgi:hypothetical protein
MSQLLRPLAPITFEAIEGLEVIEPTSPIEPLVASMDWERLYQQQDDMGEAAPRIAAMFKEPA